MRYDKWWRGVFEHAREVSLARIEDTRADIEDELRSFVAAPPPRAALTEWRLRDRMSPERELISRLLHDLSAYAALRHDTHGRRDQRFKAARNPLDRARARVRRDLGLRWCMCCGLLYPPDEEHDSCPAND